MSARWRCTAWKLRSRRWLRDEDLVNALCVDFSVVAKIQTNFLVKPVDVEGKELILVDFTVCLVGLEHTYSKQMF